MPHVLQWDPSLKTILEIIEQKLKRPPEKSSKSEKDHPGSHQANVKEITQEIVKQKWKKWKRPSKKLSSKSGKDHPRNQAKVKMNVLEIKQMWREKKNQP